MSPSMKVQERKQQLMDHFDIINPTQFLSGIDQILTRLSLLELFMGDYLLEEKFQEWAIGKQKQDEFKVVTNG